MLEIARVYQERNISECVAWLFIIRTLIIFFFTHKHSLSLFSTSCAGFWVAFFIGAERVENAIESE